MRQRINIKRNDIVIERNVIERSLMKARDVVRENRKIFLGILAGLLVACVAAIVVYLYIDSSMNKVQIRFEKAFEEYRAAKDSGDAEKTMALVKTFDEIASSSMFGFYHVINYYMIGNIYFDEGQFDKAKENLVRFAGKSSGIYAELALVKAAIAAEESGKIDEALSIYKRFEKDYPESIVSEQVYFNTGAVYEKKKDRTSAKEYYNKVISLYPQSVFAQRAKKRLVLLSSPVM